MIKEAGLLAGGALILSPVGIPILLHGVAGLLVGGAGIAVADTVLKQVVPALTNDEPEPAPDKRDELRRA